MKTLPMVDIQIAEIIWRSKAGYRNPQNKGREIVMTPDEKQRLADLAWKRLEATETDEEQYSFLFRTEGSGSCAFYPWSHIEDEEFDGDIDCVRDIWAPDRLAIIERGQEDPNEQELAQWRRARAFWLADWTDWSWLAWIVPLWEDSMVSGYALFVGDQDPDQCPQLLGVYENQAEVRMALASEGAVQGFDEAFDT